MQLADTCNAAAYAREALAPQVVRCAWSEGAELLTTYHDHEWGRAAHDDAALFEALSLEAFQSGLSWLTILRKRDAFRDGFRGFDPARVSRFGAYEVDRLMEDRGVIRHQGKIEATVNNARRAVEMIDAFGSLRAYFQRFMLMDAPPSGDAAARSMSKDLRSRGWTFVGPATVFAFMQSVGLVNGHVPACIARARTEEARLRAWR